MSTRISKNERLAIAAERWLAARKLVYAKLPAELNLATIRIMREMQSELCEAAIATKEEASRG